MTLGIFVALLLTATALLIARRGRDSRLTAQREALNQIRELERATLRELHRVGSADEVQQSRSQEVAPR